MQGGRSYGFSFWRSWNAEIKYEIKIYVHEIKQYLIKKLMKLFAKMILSDSSKVHSSITGLHESLDY